MRAPPRLAQRLISWVLREDPARRAILGDLQEDFVRTARSRGALAGNLWYWRESLSLMLSRIVIGGAAGLWGRLVQDAGYALRVLGRTPAFSLFAAAMIALGVGAATSVFSVLQPLMLAPLPFPDADRLVWIANQSPDGDQSLDAVTSRTANLHDFRERATSFDGITGYNAFYDQVAYRLTGVGEPQRLVGVGVAHDFLDVLGVQTAYGRSFHEAEGARGGPPVVILAHGFWLRAFGGDPAVVGRSLALNNEPYTVVGILPRGFDFTSIFRPGAEIDFLVPFRILRADEGGYQGNRLAMVGRLRPGVTAAAAQAELDRVQTQLVQENPRRWGLGARITPLGEQVAGPFRPALLLLAGAAATLLLIVCVNVSNLILSRSATRMREVAVRKVFGASRGRLVRQLVMEALGIALLGAALGSVLAWGVTSLVRRTAGIRIPLLEQVHVDGTALLFAILLAVATGLVVGLVPALRVVEGGESSVLRSGSRGSSASRPARRFRELLVFVEVSLACLLLVVGGLLVRSFRSVLAVDLGYDPRDAVAWQISPSAAFEEMAERASFHLTLRDRIAAVPGVEQVGLVDGLPLGRSRAWAFTLPGEPPRETDSDLVPHVIDSGYLAAMRIGLVSGRGFTSADVESSSKVVLINESGARRAFGDADPIGRRIAIWTPHDWEVVGVVSDVRDVSPETSAGIQVYFPMSQMPDYPSVDMVVRSGLPTGQIVEAVASALREVDPAMPTNEYWTLESTVGRSLSARRFTLLVLSSFGVAALLLAGLGIYGVLAQTVAERRSEIGIRMALGASSAGIVTTVLGQTLLLAGAGVVVGGVLALASARLFGALLFGVEPADPVTFAGMALTLLAVAGAAAAVPALRAARTPGAGALNSE